MHPCLSWHNYWSLYKELYSLCPNGQHVSIYFPVWMWEAIRDQRKPVIISEADLGSPVQMRGENPLPNKRYEPYHSWAAESIRHYFQSEVAFGGQFYYGVSADIASWLLTEDTGQVEHEWHEAYAEGGTEYFWFPFWYGGSEVP